MNGFTFHWGNKIVYSLSSNLFTSDAMTVESTSADTVEHCNHPIFKTDQDPVTLP
jgi:hypothetical protein